MRVLIQDMTAGQYTMRTCIWGEFEGYMYANSYLFYLNDTIFDRLKNWTLGFEMGTRCNIPDDHMTEGRKCTGNTLVCGNIAEMYPDILPHARREHFLDTLKNKEIYDSLWDAPNVDTFNLSTKHGIFLHTARMYPKRNAIIDENWCCLRYDECWALARRVAACILTSVQKIDCTGKEQDRFVPYKNFSPMKTGIKRRKKSSTGYVENENFISVGICLPLSGQGVVSELAISMTGYCFVPMDTERLPKDRIHVMMKDAQVKVVITNKKNLHLFEDYDEELVVLDFESCCYCCDTIELPRVGKNQLAYMIYTSGTTGKPKGVMVEQRSLAKFGIEGLEDFTEEYQGMRYALCVALSFDASLMNIMGAWCSGSSLIILPYNKQLDGATFLELIRDLRVDMLTSTPSQVALLGTPTKDTLPRLKIIACGGEPMPTSLVEQWTTSQRCVWNVYGPTEATVACTATKVNVGSPITIGNALPGYNLFVASPNSLTPLENGKVGELLVAGALARGYKDRPNVTNSKFLIHPNIGTRVYRTGDLAAQRADGKFEFHGRVDDQVKHRGNRFELSAVESHIRKLNYIKECCVLLHNKSLCAWVVTNDKSNDENKLRKTLLDKIPNYMVPDKFTFLDKLPLNASM
eukprot:UN22557